MSTTLKDWVAGARPRTLAAALSPVMVGTALAYHFHSAQLTKAALALVVALALQIGTNYANDYSDGKRGVDEVRVGPKRLVASGAASPNAVLRAAVISFAVAAIAGLLLSIVSHHLWLIGVGAASILAGWYYTGGSSPYGYSGLGEVFVFVFFGLVATVGTAYTQTGTFHGLDMLAASAVGTFSSAILVANNLRDIDGDKTSSKITLAIRMGDSSTRILYGVLMLVPTVLDLFSSVFAVGMLFGLGSLGMSLSAIRKVQAGARGAALVPVLILTSKALLVNSTSLVIGLYLTR